MILGQFTIFRSLGNKILSWVRTRTWRKFCNPKILHVNQEIIKTKKLEKLDKAEIKRELS